MFGGSCTRLTIAFVALLATLLAPGSWAVETFGDKRDGDGLPVTFNNMVVTALFPDCCYVWNKSQMWGIMVCSPDGGGYPDPGTKVNVWGNIRTNQHGERYLDVTDGQMLGSEAIGPVAITNAALGGGDWNFDRVGTSGAGQRGVDGGAGLNNIGLLVKTTGAFGFQGCFSFTINDGSGTYPICETPFLIMANPAWRYVAVTGISSMKFVGGQYKRMIRVNKIQPIVSDPSEGITGRWEATGTSGDTSGVLGMLLVQQGARIEGSVRGWPIRDAQMSGNVFSCAFTSSAGDIAASLALDGDTLSGTCTFVSNGQSFPIVFQKISPDPVAPYVDRPKVLRATCDGTSIDILWDRPVFGCDYDIHDSNGQSILMDWGQYGNTYDPATHVYHIALSPSLVFTPGSTYTVYLDSGDSVDWYDPYGIPAWDWVDDCYSFTYIAN